MKKVIWSLLVFVALTFTQSAPATASVLTLLMDGTFDVNSTLGGVAFGNPTPFHVEAAFDTITNQIINGTIAEYPTTAQFTIGGITYSTSGNAYVYLENTISGSYIVGLEFGSLSAGNQLRINYNAATPGLDVTHPTDTVFSNYGGADFIIPPANILPLNISFSGGTVLSINGVLDQGTTPIAADPTASLVPEPTTYTLLGLGLGCVAFARRKMNKINQAENS
jgi:hypothetical protein